MPFFKWYAADAQGAVKQGVLFARDITIVQEQLRQQHYILIASSSSTPFIPYRVLAQERIACFRQLGWLLGKGIRLIDALSITTRGAQHAHVRKILQDCTEAVTEGMQLSEVASCHAEFFNSFCCRMIVAGEASGALAQTCTDVATYATIMSTFAQKIREALFGPLITLCVFVVILAVLLYAIIPRFGAVLQGVPGTLPARTQTILAISAWLRSPTGTTGVLLILFTGCLFAWFSRRYMRSYGATLFSYLPILRNGIEDLSAALFFRTLCSLLCNGSHITNALSIASLSISSSRVREQYERVYADVVEGVPLSIALTTHVPFLAAECSTLLQVGEATGKLGAMAQACAELYQERVVQWCRLISRLAQPILLLLLGLLVGLLLLALYEPIFSMGNLVA